MLFPVFVLAIISCAILTGCVRWYALRRLVDVPNQRSSHSIAIPRGGGAAVAMTVLSACALVCFTQGDVPPSTLAAIAALATVAALGWIDDHYSLRAHTRLTIQLIVVSGVIWIAGLPTVHVGGVLLPLPSLILVPIAIAACTWMINLTNFMDGIDGIACQQAIIGCSGAALAMALHGDALFACDRWPLLLAVATIGASIGFLPWNWPRARIFLGDVGSTFLGLVFALLVLAQIAAGVDVDIAVLPFMPFIADATSTLVRRGWRRENLAVAHRSHLYQRLAVHWRAHWPVALLYCCLALLGCIGSTLTLLGGLPHGSAIMAWCAIYSCVVWYGHRVAPS